MRLEYRLDDEFKQYPALWNYQNITPVEAVARMTCEYFVKDGETYAVTATALDPDGTSVLYVKKESYTNDPQEKGILILVLKLGNSKGMTYTLSRK